MTILIIEDERPAAERLAAMVREFDASIRIAATLQSVKESVDWFSCHAAPDCILADIQLNDGLSLEIFKKHPIAAPIIFTTAYDEYLLKAFAFNSIDYLLKPVNKAKLFHSLNKYLTLRQHFGGNVSTMNDQLQRRTPITDRLVVKKGTDFIALRMEQIAYFYSEHKITFLIDIQGIRYIIDKPLADIERSTDSAQFFRINRKYLANINAVARFRSFEKGKVLIDLLPPVNEEVVVSQENSSAFKVWIGK
jgi:two-component system LytT family response regulator